MSSSKTLQDRRSFWQLHVSACQRSSLSKAQYCREHHLEYHQLIYWYPKFSASAQLAIVHTEKSKFLPVMVEQPTLPSGLHVILPNGVVIHGITERSVNMIGALIDQL